MSLRRCQVLFQHLCTEIYGMDSCLHPAIPDLATMEERFPIDKTEAKKLPIFYAVRPRTVSGLVSRGYLPGRSVQLGIAFFTRPDLFQRSTGPRENRQHSSRLPAPKDTRLQHGRQIGSGTRSVKQLEKKTSYFSAPLDVPFGDG